jgi:hypothetical protein
MGNVEDRLFNKEFQTVEIWPNYKAITALRSVVFLCFRSLDLFGEQEFEVIFERIELISDLGDVLSVEEVMDE